MAVRQYMNRCKVLLMALLVAALALGVSSAFAAEVDPIVCSIEVDPSKLPGPGTVNVTITIANSSDADLKDPVTLCDPTTKIVSDFGTNGSAILKAGESKTWTGTYDVSQNALDNGFIVYYAQYTLYKESGEAVAQSQPIRAAISKQTAEAAMEVKRTISQTAAREGQEITVRYEIHNAGTVSLTDIAIQENKDIHAKKQTIKELKAGQTAEIKYPVTMGKKDLTSGATITYKSETSNKTQTYTVENTKIVYGESSLEVKLTTSSKGVPVNENITLTLTVKNKGSVAVSDLRVSDPTQGELFSNQEVAAGKTLTLEKELTLTETTDYQFTVAAIDATGAEVTAVTEPVKVTTVDPGDVLSLEVTATPDKTEVYESPGLVRFTIIIHNNCNVAATNAVVRHGDTALYTFETIPAGETRKLTRDTALSMAGKFRFTVTAEDPLENNLTFQSNEMQIAFSVPTPAPATATPPPVPTEEPTFSPVTMPPISDPSIGAAPKTIQSILLPILILAGVLLVASGALLIVATKRRADQRKAAESAVDHLERAKRRDYVTPAEEKPSEQEDDTLDADAVTAVEDDDDLGDFGLPPIDAVAKAREESGYPAYSGELYDEEMTSDLGQYEQTDASYDQPYPEDADAAPEAYESDGYTDDYADGYATDGEGYADDGLGYDEPDVDGHVPDDREAEAYTEPPVETGRTGRRSRVDRGAGA